MAKNKQVQRLQPASGKFIQAPDVQNISTDDQKPVISFHYHGSEFCITDCDVKEKAAFVERLYTLSQSTWADITKLPRKTMGYEQIPYKQIKAKFPQGITEDLDEFMVFRFHGKGRIAGYRTRAVFHVVWVDCKLKLYNHGS